MATDKPLVVLIGPTASGKTSVAIQLAKKYDGEVICADSRTVYKGMDIGTAKPSHVEQAGIPHWGIDLVEPNERFTAAEFKKYAMEKIDSIRSRNKTPFLVGGTGLYVDAVLFDYEFPKPMSAENRKEFEQMDVRSLYKYCLDNNIELPVDDKNKRRLLRAINDPNNTYKRKNLPIENSIVVGIATKIAILEERIEARTETMFLNGVVDEATTLAKKYGWEAEAMTSNVYRELRGYLDGNVTLEEAKRLFATRDRQLAKRQMTWFRRNPYIEWVSLDEASMYVAQRLDSE